MQSFVFIYKNRWVFTTKKMAQSDETSSSLRLEEESSSAADSKSVSLNA